MVDDTALPSDSHSAPHVARASAPATVPLFGTEPVPHLKNHTRDSKGNLEVQTMDQIGDQEAEDDGIFGDGWMSTMNDRLLDEHFLDMAGAMDPRALAFLVERTSRANCKRGLRRQW